MMSAAAGKFMMMVDLVREKIIKAEVRRIYLYRRMPAMIPFDLCLYYGPMLLFLASRISPVLSFFLAPAVWLTNSMLVLPVLLGPKSSKKNEKLVSSACEKHGYFTLCLFLCLLALSTITGVLPTTPFCCISITALSVVKLVAIPTHSSRFIILYMAPAIIAASAWSSLQYTMLLPLLLAWAALVIPLDVKELRTLFESLPDDATQLLKTVREP